MHSLHLADKARRRAPLAAHADQPPMQGETALYWSIICWGELPWALLISSLPALRVLPYFLSSSPSLLDHFCRRSGI
jgi:hypothetical protein